jgi:hypothetical protein
LQLALNKGVAIFVFQSAGFGNALLNFMGNVHQGWKMLDGRAKGVAELEGCLLPKAYRTL